MNALCCFQPSSTRGSMPLVWQAGGAVWKMPFFFFTGFVKGHSVLCTIGVNVMWSFYHIYMFTPASTPSVLWGFEITYVCTVHACLYFRRKKTKLTRHRSERQLLPGDGYISVMDVKVSRSIQGRLIMVSLKWPISFHKQRDRRLSCVRLGHRT